MFKFIFLNISFSKILTITCLRELFGGPVLIVQVMIFFLDVNIFKQQGELLSKKICQRFLHRGILRQSYSIAMFLMFGIYKTTWYNQVDISNMYSIDQKLPILHKLKYYNVFVETIETVAVEAYK